MKGLRYTAEFNACLNKPLKIWMTFCTNMRVSQTRTKILDGLSVAHKAFLEFVLFKYIDTGFEELDQSRLPNLIELKYHSMTDAADALGGVDEIRGLFFNFQKQLYEAPAITL